MYMYICGVINGCDESQTARIMLKHRYRGEREQTFNCPIKREMSKLIP